MTRWILLFCILAGSQLAQAAEGIYLELGIQPDRLVKSTTDSTVEMVMDMKGDETIIENNRQRGITFPLNLTSHSQKVFSIKTGKADSTGTIQFVQKLVDSSSYSENKNGKRLDIPDPTQDFVGVELNGMFNPQAGIRLTGITGKKLSAEKEQMVRAVFSSMLSTLPKKPIGPLKIGDSYNQEAPFALPMPGRQPIRFTTDTKYTLKRIKGKKAYFDVTVSFKMLGVQSNAKINLTSSGRGTMEYNLDTKLQEKLALVFDMDLKAQQDDLTISSKMKSTATTVQQLVNENGKSGEGA